MKVFLARTADDCLWSIWEQDRQYSEDFAHGYQDALDQFIRCTLRDNPLIGHVWHEARGIRRAVFRQRHNIYYTLTDEIIHVLFIFDGRMDVNQQIAASGLRLDDLKGPDA